jgi:hypothetical protein
MTFARRIALLILPSILLMELPAQAADVQVGTALVCDTEQQVERFIAFYDGDAEAAVEAVNAEVRNPTACALAEIVYVPGPPLATTRKRVATFQIVQVLVIGIVTPNGVRGVEPAHFFSVLEVEERDA